jgi:RNA polymerase sigma-70 factor (ECF subfamily)
MAVGITRSRLSDVHLAEDATQEAFAVACRKLALLKDRRRFPEWLGTICRRTASRMARARPDHKPLDEAQLPAPLPTDDTKFRARIQKGLENLSAKGREVILLHYFSGLSYEAIAKSLGISEQSVHGRLQRARRALAQELSALEKSELAHD